MNGWHLALKTAFSQSRLSIHANLIPIVHLFTGLRAHRTRAPDHFNSSRMSLIKGPLVNMTSRLPRTKGLLSDFSKLGRWVGKMLKWRVWKCLRQTPWTPGLSKGDQECALSRSHRWSQRPSQVAFHGERAFPCPELQVSEGRSVECRGSPKAAASLCKTIWIRHWWSKILF